VAEGREEVGGIGQRSRYVFNGYRRWDDQDGYPAVQTPWGTLNAVDLNTGATLWKIPFGEYPELVEKGFKDHGTESYGAPVVTASGLVFIGATIFDRKLRAFDSQTGKLLWETLLPFPGTATPAVYEAGGRQFVVIATSSARNRKAGQGAAYVAYALPR
jgi:quinoprotein glucose dehydrogenase